jgi:chromodomain-helicase-DNA-binding protein 7
MNLHEIEGSNGGEAALGRYRSQLRGRDLTVSLTIPSLLTFDEDYIDSSWFEVDRVIDHKNDGVCSYLVKWKNQEYSASTWETGESLPSEAIEKYHVRCRRNNPKRIPSYWVRPDESSYFDIEDPGESKLGDVLRDYQLYGVNWLRCNWYCRRNSILADESGLGKTVQMVVTLVSLNRFSGLRGPFLVLAPVWALDHWRLEFETWSDFNVVIFHGTEKSRRLIIEKEMTVSDDRGRIQLHLFRPDVVITSYDMVTRSRSLFDGIDWRYLVADEGHMLTTSSSKRYETVMGLKFEHCSILTGTPIQNNGTELWPLLHFCDPVQFAAMAPFIAEYKDVTDISQIQAIQELYGPILLRRKKSQVEETITPEEETIIEVELTEVQKKYYGLLLHQRSSMLRQITSGSVTALQNLAMQLRKLCSHPFLIKGAKEWIQEQAVLTNPGLSPSGIRAKAIVESSGKMILISKLLPKLRDDGHKVLIFSQMVRVLDIIEEYLLLQEYQIGRIDESQREPTRRESIDRFNENPDAFILLLSAKSAEVLTDEIAADTIIIHDCDWNRHNDVQAETQCIRIEQRATVEVYRLITRGTYESVLLDSGYSNQAAPVTAQQLDSMLRYGVSAILGNDTTEIDRFSGLSIEEILQHYAKVRRTDLLSSNDSTTFEPEQLPEAEKDFWGKLFPNSASCADGLIDKDSDNQIICDLMDRGYRHRPAELVLLRRVLMVNDDEPVDGLDTINQIVNSSDGPEECEDITQEIVDSAAKLIPRVAQFWRLERVLFFVQGPISRWPDIEPRWGSRAADYAIMLGLFQFGWSAFESTFDDPVFQELDPRPPRLTAEKGRRRVRCLISELEPDINDDLIVPEGFIPIPLQEWMAQHPVPAETETPGPDILLQVARLITEWGLPRKSSTDFNTDWGRLLKHIDNPPFSELELTSIGEELYAAIKNFSTPQAIEFKGILQQLNGAILDVEITEMRSAIDTHHDLEIYMFAPVDCRTYALAVVNRDPAFPAWWNRELDRALMNAMYSYGLRKVSSFLVDPQFPFLQHIPPKRVGAFRRAAAQELSGAGAKAGTLPWEVHSFHFLYSRHLRFRRVTAIAKHIKVVPARMPVSIAPPILSPPQPQIGPHDIQDFGTMTRQSYNHQRRYGGLVIPVSYTAHVSLVDMDGKVHPFLCIVNQAINTLAFVVVSFGIHGRLYEADSPDQVWRLVLRSEHLTCDFQEGMGYQLYGLDLAHVRKKITDMDRAFRVAQRIRQAGFLEPPIPPVATPTF